MEENSVVFDISSDEEPTPDVAAGGDDFSWITKLLCDDVDDADDVVVVGEIKSKSLKVATINNENDDDCVVLDGDPDKPVAVDDVKGDDGDDLVIVSSKGQIACRDYPHPRHLCAKFIFSSTPPKMHCNLCHCYVCDTLAPCAHWGTGDTSTDHCHATEKKEFWKSLRKTLRLEKDAPLTVQVPDTSSFLPLPQVNETSPRDIIRVLQNPVPRPAIIRSCSSKRRLTVPNMINQYRNRHSGLAFSHRHPIRLAQRSQMLGVRNNGMQNPGMFKRPGIIAGGGCEVKQFVYGSSNNIRNTSGSQHSQNAVPRATSNDRIDVPWVPSINHDSFTYQSTSQVDAGNVFRSTVPSQPLVHSQPLPQPEIYSQPIPIPQLFSQPIPEPQLYSQPITGPQLYSQPIPKPQLYSQPIPEPHAYTQHNLSSNEGQNVNEQGNEMQNSTCPDFSEFDEWLSKTSQSNQQPQVEKCQLPRTECIHEPLPAEDFNSQCNGSAKLPYDDIGFGSWHQESHFGQISEGYVPLDLDAVTSVPAAFDAGLAHTLSEDLF